MDAISNIMFSFTFLLGFVFSLLGLFELKDAITEQEAPVIGTIFCFLAVVGWFMTSMFWTTLATAEMFVPLGLLWTAFGWIFVILGLTNVMYIVKYVAAHSNKDSSLQIQNRNDE